MSHDHTEFSQENSFIPEQNHHTHAETDQVTHKKLHKKKDKKQGKLQAICYRDRYRMICDIIEEHHDLILLADRKSRFGLIILGAFNAMYVLLTVQAYYHLAHIAPTLRLLISGVFGIYAICAMCVFIVAIEALRPRKYTITDYISKDQPDISYHESIMNRTQPQYVHRVSEITWQELIDEKALASHALSKILQSKYNALEFLFSAMLKMTVSTVVLFAIMGILLVL